MILVKRGVFTGRLTRIKLLWGKALCSGNSILFQTEMINPCLPVICFKAKISLPQNINHGSSFNSSLLHIGVVRERSLYSQIIIARHTAVSLAADDMPY